MLSEESSNEMSETESESETSVAVWEDVTMGDDAHGEMIPPNKAIRPSKDKKGVTKHIEKKSVPDNRL
jgi:hypothetical protein